MSILQTILEHKRKEIDQARNVVSLSEMKRRAEQAPPVRPFRDSLRGHGLSVIAEIKKASPSKGMMVKEFHPASLAQEFESHGAAALSVLTDSEFFQGDPTYIQAVKSAASIPVLRKDFIIDEYQVYESRSIGADAILLIVSALSQKALEQFYRLARSVGMDVLVEVHSADEVQRVNAIQAEIIGVNNRDLGTFNVSLDTSLRLKPLIRSEAVTVSESGIADSKDALVLREAGFDAVLVGEGLMLSSNRKKTLQQIKQA
ncbi:MAG: indole-3-glycerol phosphate synthase TrpC [Anaerolineae bacterium]|nr:indole-3-glycerol phosphate synthase TrpC [Anaerolineae bacterium]MCI0706477.1 indole-3-glycerol phosphate synthase TrpC [Ignavibacteriota bacterium]